VTRWLFFPLCFEASVSRFVFASVSFNSRFFFFLLFIFAAGFWVFFFFEHHPQVFPFWPSVPFVRFLFSFRVLRRFKSFFSLFFSSYPNFFFFQKRPSFLHSPFFCLPVDPSAHVPWLPTVIPLLCHLCVPPWRFPHFANVYVLVSYELGCSFLPILSLFSVVFCDLFIFFFASALPARPFRTLPPVHVSPFSCSPLCPSL